MIQTVTRPPVVSAEEAASPIESTTPEAGAGPSRSDLHGALQALAVLARLHHVAAEPHALRHALGLGENDPVSRDNLLLAAKHIGLKAKSTRSSPDRLTVAPMPALAVMNDGRVVVLAQCDGQRVLFMDPSATVADGAQAARPTIEPMEVFATQWSGELILVTSRASLTGALAKFDFSWFIPSIVKHRKLLGEVLLVSLFLQLFALVSPLFFQVVMDKVLVHKGVTTLDVIVISLVVIMLFESVLTVLRTYVFSHTTSRIDVELGARLFRHLLNLPLAYLTTRPYAHPLPRQGALRALQAHPADVGRACVPDLPLRAELVDAGGDGDGLPRYRVGYGAGEGGAEGWHVRTAGGHV